MGMSVSLSVCLSMHIYTHQNFTKFSVYVACGRGSVHLLWHCNKLCASSSVDDNMFSYNGPYGGVMLSQQYQRNFVHSLTSVPHDIGGILSQTMTGAKAR